MKLIMAIIDGEDEKEVSAQMLQGGFSVTKIGSTGGMLKKKRTTLMCAVRSERMNDALDIIKANTRQRRFDLKDMVEKTGEEMPEMDGVLTVGGATVFVLPIENCYKF